MVNDFRDQIHHIDELEPNPPTEGERLRAESEQLQEMSRNLRLVKWVPGLRLEIERQQPRALEPEVVWPVWIAAVVAVVCLAVLLFAAARDLISVQP